MKTINLTKFNFLAAILMVAMMGFGSGVHAQATSNTGQPKTKKEVEAALTNFSISLVFDAQGQKPYYFFQARCRQGWAFRLEGEKGSQFTVVDEAAQKVYRLNYQEKTGEERPFQSRNAYRGIETMLATHLFGHEYYMNDSNFKKGGSETIAGRPTTIYVYQLANGTATYWIDNQYGFTLKFVQTGPNPMHTEVTEFKVGSVTMADMVNLADYKLK